MDFQKYLKSLDQQSPPEVNAMLVALWYDSRGDWEQAHNIVQDMNSEMAYWVHAYLHRKEGDLGNAGYWYSRAGKIKPEVSLSTEWELMVKELL